MKAPARLALAAVFCAVLASTAAVAEPPAANDKGDPETAEMRAQLQRVKDAVNSAKKPEDLDPVLFDLQKYENNGFGFGINGSFTPDKQALYRQLVSALEFTKEWQSYLSHLASGQAEMARNDLSSLLQNNYGIGILPRSRLLALQAGRQAPPAVANGSAPLSQVPEAQKIIDGINTLDDLQTALGQLNSRGQDDPLAREYAQHLAPMVEVYGDLKHGLPTSVNINFMGDVSGAGVSIKANSLLLKFILQHYFDTYTGAPPGDDETPAAYAERVKNDALAGHDWKLLKKALTVHAQMFRNVAGSGAPDNEATGLDDMMSGLNQQDAGQYALAVESFQKALKSGGLDVPAKFIGEQLDAIKRDHPTEYDAGMETFLTPQAPVYPGMNPAMYNSGYPTQRYHPGRSGYPGNTRSSAPGQPDAVLSIPGTATNAPPAMNAPPASTNTPPAVK